MTDRKYYTVVVCEDGEPWEVHYGSYDKAEAAEEAFEATQSGYRRSNVKLITTATDKQEGIDKAVADLNNK